MYGEHENKFHWENEQFVSFYFVEQLPLAIFLENTGYYS